MKKILLIDGENFVHSVVHSLQQSNAIRTRQQLHRIDCKQLFTCILPNGTFADISYYTTKIQISRTPAKLQKSLNLIRSWNARWVPYLANQGIHFVKAGNLRVRDSKRCSHCGHKTAVLQEKGVDVRLAVDIVTRAGKGVELYVLSSDADILSAVHGAKARGAKVIYVAFAGAKNHALAQAADSYIEIMHADVFKAFKKVNP